MFDYFKNRMAVRGRNMSEILRMQSNAVIEHTWMNDPNYRQVYVVRVNHGLPEVTDEHELVDVKFNVDTYQKVESNEPAYHLQFRHGSEKQNPDICIGSYVYIADEDGVWKWWMITSLDERPQFRQYTINECNWTFGWVVDGKIYQHLGILRQGSSTREVDENSYTSVVNGNAVIWMATNVDTQTIGHDQRFLISDSGRMPPLCFSVATINDVMPVGLTKFVMSQSTFDANHDNAELMLADYYSTSVEPSMTNAENSTIRTATLTYSGTKPTIKIGGSWKTFTPVFSEEDVVVDSWFVCDEDGDISSDVNYVVERDGEQLKLKVAKNYNLIGTVLTIHVTGSDKSNAEVKVEVV
jgi:hypothetical protein